jgi:hypothetical protein
VRGNKIKFMQLNCKFVFFSAVFGHACGKYEICDVSYEVLQTFRTNGMMMCHTN